MFFNHFRLLYKQQLYIEFLKIPFSLCRSNVYIHNLNKRIWKKFPIISFLKRKTNINRYEHVLFDLFLSIPKKKNKIYVLRFLCMSICCLVAESCLILCDPMDCSSQGSSVHGITQTRILEWVAISFSRGSSGPKDWTCVSTLAGGFFTTEPLGSSYTHANIVICK